MRKKVIFIIVTCLIFSNISTLVLTSVNVFATDSKENQFENNKGDNSFEDPSKSTNPIKEKEPIKAKDVVVKYVDEVGNKISNDNIISGNVGDSYNAWFYELNIPGYIMDDDKLSDNIEGIFSDEEQTVVFSYFADRTKINIHDSTIYVGDKWSPADNFDSATDAYGNLVDRSDVISEGKVNTNKVGVYEVTYLMEALNPELGEATATITVKEKPVKAKDVVVKYVDQDGNEIYDEQIISGNVDDSYDASSDKYRLTIDGYSLDETKVPNNAIGIFSDVEQIVMYVYERTEAAPVTVKYEDEDGNELAAEDTLNGKIGLSYQSTAKNISGWALKETPTNAAGLFTEKEQVVTFEYEKIKSNQPIVPPTNTDKESSISSSKSVGDKSNSSLPQAGEQQSSRIWGVLGILLLGSSVLVVGRRRKNQN